MLIFYYFLVELCCQLCRPDFLGGVLDHLLLETTKLKFLFLLQLFLLWLLVVLLMRPHRLGKKFRHQWDLQIDVLKYLICCMS